MDFKGLKNVLEEFDSHGWKGAFLSGDWQIANGGYDLWFELSYQGEVVARCVDGELSFKNRLNGSVMKDLCDEILGVYDNLKVDPSDKRKMLEGSFEVGQEFFEKETGRYFTLTGEGGRSFNIWNIDVFDSNKEFLHKTSVHAGRLAMDILNGDIVVACEAQKGLDIDSLSGEEPLVDIYDLAFDDEGYLHFQVEADGYSLEGLFRVYDPANGPDLSLVSIDFGDRHPVIGRQWDRIEMALVDASLDRYNEIPEVIEMKERVLKAMEAADYFYDEINSSDYNHRFNGDYGTTLNFDSFTEVAAWLDGVVFDDPDVSDRVEKIMHPERFEDLKGLDEVISLSEKISKSNDKGLVELNFGER